MDEQLAERLDLPGLRSVLPDLVGDPHHVALAEVLRLSVVGGILDSLAAVAERGTPEDDVLRLWGDWASVVIAAPVLAGWWLAAQPVTAHLLATHAISKTRDSSTIGRTPR